MKILVLNYEFPPLGGGGGVAAYKLAKGFVKLGHEVDYVTTWFKGLEKNEIIDGINIHRVKVLGRKELPTATMLSMVTFPFFAYPRCVSLFKKNNYDLIITYFAVPTGPLGVWLSRKFKVKNILRIIGGDIYDPTKKNSPHNKWYLRKVVNWVIRNSDHITAISTNTKENALKYYDIDKEIEVIPIPYEPFRFKKVSRKELGLKDGKKYIIGVGRLVKRKGFDYFIRALALLPEDVEGIIISDGPERKNLEQLAKELGVDKRLHMLGYVSEERKFQYLDNADVYVLSSVHEGFGIMLQEAMQVGLPIAATNNGGQIDFVKDGVNGYLVDYGSADSLARNIKKLLGDEKDMQKFCKHNKEGMKSFGVEVISRNYLG